MQKLNFLFIGIAALLAITSCSKKDPSLPDNTANFQSTSLGLGDGETSKDITVTLDRAATADIKVTLQLTDSLVTYGTTYTTEPAAANNTVTLTIPLGSTSASLTVKKTDGVLLDGDEKVSFAITAVSQPAVIGNAYSASLQFAAIVSDGTQLTLDGGVKGADADSSVFVDFSANEQTDVSRGIWDLGFYSGDDYRVILNYTLKNAMAVALNKTDLTTVNAADTVGMVLVSTYSPGDLAKVDDPITGDLSKTVISAVSATDADNKVYILNRGGTAPYRWVKIKIIRKNGGYQLQYANISEATFKTVDIAKETSHQFSYVSLENGQTVSFAPAKGHWDIQWGVASYYTASGASNIYYPFSDLVFTNNLDGVQAAEVLTSTISYDNYAESNIASTTFKSDRDVIGGNWRATTGSAIGVKTDRFYVIKDPAGNVYKLKFVSFISNDGGTRGKPVIEYKLVKKA